MVINSLLANQEKTLEALNINLDSISKLNGRVNGSEKHLEIHDTHIETHDKHLDALCTHLANHDKYLNVHDQHFELLPQRIDLLE